MEPPGATGEATMTATMTATYLTLATEANAAGDCATVALCFLALGYSRRQMLPHIRAACPAHIRAAGARRILDAAAAAARA
jgi:hypothetical protein